MNPVVAGMDSHIVQEFVDLGNAEKDSVPESLLLGVALAAAGDDSGDRVPGLKRRLLPALREAKALVGKWCREQAGVHRPVPARPEG